MALELHVHAKLSRGAYSAPRTPSWFTRSLRSLELRIALKFFSLFFYYPFSSLYRWEDSWEARWAQSDYLWATQGPLNSQKCAFLYIVAHIWKTGGYFFPLVLHMSVLLWGLTALKFSFNWVWCKGPPGPPKYEKKYYFFHILGLNLKNSYQIASLFHMYI